MLYIAITKIMQRKYFRSIPNRVKRKTINIKMICIASPLCMQQSKTGGLRHENNMPCWATCLPFTVVQLSMTLNIHLTKLVYYTEENITTSSNVTWYNWNRAHLALNNNQSMSNKFSVNFVHIFLTLARMKAMAKLTLINLRILSLTCIKGNRRFRIWNLLCCNIFYKSECTNVR